MGDRKFIEKLSPLEKAELIKLIPNLPDFLSYSTVSAQEARERKAIELHHAAGSVPPWLQRSHDDDSDKRRYSANTVRLSQERAGLYKWMVTM